MNKPERFAQLTPVELYILKRALAEASFTFFMMDKYSKEEQKMHNALLNEIVETLKNRKENHWRPNSEGGFNCL